MDKLALKNDMNIMQVGEVFAKSGFFVDAKDASKAIVKILAGQELGFGAFASMRSIHIVQGKPVVGADLIAARIKQSERYDFEVVKHDETGCTLRFFGVSKRTKKWEVLGESSFSVQDAQKAGLTGKDNYKKYARNMFFARAISNGCAWYCPDVFEGRVYTEEEIPGEETPEEYDSEVGKDLELIETLDKKAEYLRMTRFIPVADMYFSDKEKQWRLHSPEEWLTELNRHGEIIKEELKNGTSRVDNGQQEPESKETPVTEPTQEELDLIIDTIRGVYEKDENQLAKKLNAIDDAYIDKDWKVIEDLYQEALDNVPEGE